jgi:hexosaminidase
MVLALLCALILKISLAQAAIQPDGAGPAAKYGIIPAPQSLRPMPGDFTLAPGSRLTINRGAAKEAAVYFKNFIAPATGYDLAIVRADKPESGAVNLVLEDGEDGFASPEGYALSVSPDRIIIRAVGVAGLFYGLQSLRQMLPPQIESAYPFNSVKWRIAGVKIKDRPLYAYRGMHLDVSRHFFAKDFVKRYIDFLALHKMNVFHWHLTDDQGWRIEIKQYPRLTSVGSRRPQTVIGHPYDRVHFYDRNPVEGFYSQEDIKEIVEYARRRQVTIIPEIDVPGHSSALLAAYPEYGCV